MKKHMEEKNKRLMKLNTFLAKPIVIIFICVLIDLIAVFCVNFLLHFISNIKYTFTDPEHISEYIGIMNGFKFSRDFTMIYMALMIILLIVDGLFAYNIRVAYAEMNIGQKGDERWATIDEIRKEYKEIPMRGGKTFKGKAGFIVSQYEDKLYVDDGAVNNLIVGTTRSGKGEMEIMRMLDIYSRAEEKASIIATDPKLELFSASAETLKKRGFDVFVLNFIDPNHSTLLFNPLSMIIDRYKAGDYSEAELLTNSLCYSVFNPDEGDGDSQFWANNSSNLLAALILGTVIDCVEADQAENTNKHEKKVTMYSVINMFQEMANIEDEDGRTMLDHYFINRPDRDLAKMKYAAVGLAGARTKGSIFSNLLAKLTVFTYQEIAKVTAESSINLEDVGFGERPAAIFIGLPDYDHSKDFIASVFIRQLYFALAKKATFTRNGRCQREVIFMLDEFGNLPAIENMASIITVCLSRGIRFNLFVQALNQGKNLYKDAWDTIYENCGNKMYIMSGNIQTAEEFSKMCGSKTIVNTHRSGKKLSLDKNITEMYEEKRLITANELMNLKEGECVMIRTTKRRNNHQEKIIPRPIFNSCDSKTAFSYRYEYLLDDFPDNRIPEDYLHGYSLNHIDLSQRVYIPEILKRAKGLLDGNDDKCMTLKLWAVIENILLQFYDEDEVAGWAVKNIEEFKTFIIEKMMLKYAQAAKTVLDIIKKERG